MLPTEGMFKGGRTQFWGLIGRTFKKGGMVEKYASME